MAQTRQHEIVIAELEAAGVPHQYERDGRRHPRVVFWIAGKELSYTCCVTHSDHRSLANTRCGIRRILRQHGIEPPR